jgi:hypothetical protein
MWKTGSVHGSRCVRAESTGLHFLIKFKLPTDEVLEHFKLVARLISRRLSESSRAICGHDNERKRGVVSLHHCGQQISCGSSRRRDYSGHLTAPQGVTQGVKAECPLVEVAMKPRPWVARCGEDEGSTTGSRADKKVVHSLLDKLVN